MHRLLTLMALCVACRAGVPPAAAVVATVGAPLPPFALQDTSGVLHRSDDARGSGRALVVSFWSAGCPCAAACEEELVALATDHRADAAVLAIASGADEPPALVARAVREKRFPFPVLLDPEGLVAARLGAESTPTSLVVDREGVLRFRGDLERIAPKAGDVNVGDVVLRDVTAGPAVCERFAREALDDVLAGRSVRVPTTPVGGCRIARPPSRK